jgi:hypothetical protein
MITVYAYDATTKELLGTTQAQESPLETGVILMPANSTNIQPPAVGEKQKQVFNGSGWDVVADLRGTVYYDADGKEYTQKELGDLPEWALLEKPVIPEPVIPKTVFTKLAIRRTCRTLGLEGKLNALLASSDEFMSDWTDAQDIDLADPVLLQALQAGTFTEDEINSIKNSLQ